MTSRSTKSFRKNLHAIKEAPKPERQNFKLPGSMSLSDIWFPIMLKPSLRHANWEDIVAKHDERVTEVLNNSDREEVRSLSETIFENKETDYIQNNVFGLLLPALEHTLNKAKIWNAFEDPHCLFNGVDHIAQYLWNNNPRYPERKAKNVYIFDMPWVQDHLQQCPRPLYPKSWIWTEEYAALIIQRTYRRYLAQQDPEIREMRLFWQKMAVEEHFPDDVSANPILLRKFASSTNNIRVGFSDHTQTMTDKKSLDSSNL